MPRSPADNMNRLHLSILGLHPEPVFHEGKSHEDKKETHQAHLPGQERLWQWPPAELTGGALAAALRSRRMERIAERLEAPQTHAETCLDDPEALLLARFSGVNGDHGTAALSLQADLSVDAELRVALGKHPDIVAVSQVMPVHLQAGTDNAVLMGARFLHVEPKEWAALHSDLNQWLQADGICLFSAASGRLYLGFTVTALERVGAVDLPPLGCALNRHVGQLLAGDELRPFRRWLTELQMWLYAHAVNAERAKTANAARPEINSLWVWGRSPWPTPEGAETSRSTSPTAADRTTSDDRPLIYTDSAVLAGALRLHDADKDESNLVVVLSTSSRPDINELVACGVPLTRPVHVVWSEPLWCYLEGDVEGWGAALHALDDFVDEMQRAGYSPEQMILDDGAQFIWKPARARWLSTLIRWFGRS